jgi:hypothetical protein
MEKAPIMFHVPVEMKVLLEKAAEERNIPLTAFVRATMAEVIGYVLPPSQLGRARKYATIEEREAAQKVRNLERRDTIKALLLKYRAGEISI